MKTNITMYEGPGYPLTVDDVLKTPGFYECCGENECVHIHPERDVFMLGEGGRAVLCYSLGTETVVANSLEKFRNLYAHDKFRVFRPGAPTLSLRLEFSR